MKHAHIFSAVLALSVAATAIGVSPAHAQVGAAAPANPGDPAARPFVEKLVGDGFAVLRDKSIPRTAARARFRELLQQDVALDDIGMRLIRRQRASLNPALTPAQIAAYRAAFPEFVLNAYADRLYDYADARVQVQRTVGRGAFTEVYTRVTRPGAQPIDTIWQVKSTNGKYQVNNLVVAGINLALTQEADFTSYIGRNGFDALVAFLKTANAKSLAVNTGPK
ncbi:ABC transporter substrate-binding protein [Sandarakinorhabdus sp.]|uniref:MlaC/ttg2D family ABC transporter substrate-binding protein n=1 Tax=Sandarakinorhabdus sp. TaxID=1916663 RepID=UPI00333E6087